MAVALPPTAYGTALAPVPTAYAPQATALAPAPIAAPMYAPQYAQPVAADQFSDIEEEEDETYFWHYSKFALPWLVVCLLLLATLFGLTFWQHAGTIKDQFDGIPRVLVLERLADGDDEGGMPKTIRNLRITSLFFGFLGVLGAFVVFFARPKPSIRVTTAGLCALLLVVCAATAWVAFGIAMDHYEDAKQCPDNGGFTWEKCRDRTAFAIAAMGVDGVLGVMALIAAIQLSYNARAGHWRMPPRGTAEELRDQDLEAVKERKPGTMIQRNVSYVRRWLVALSLVAVLFLAIAELAFVIVLHEDREVTYVRSYRGRAASDMTGRMDMPYEHAGWSQRNSRIRYAGAGIGLLAILLNFMPFRSRTLAIIFAFIYFVAGSLCCTAFGFDAYELREADKLPCPWTVDGQSIECTKSPFIATAFFDLFTGLALYAYVVVEFIFGCSGTAQEDRAARAYGVFRLEKPEVSVPVPLQARQW
eukprot:NODE_951_length_1538_cov_216.708009_g940_i0.p2 GENE.NODE_951_length_1538_cov_216.708009_g940_i0~~NODE_951_length_1538_cov_216.708009_g940_i0.p2  ORF type:complete len:475 (-),score=112.62 NODE_951_length_1538_cov_216.708009_g940_i0:74-1498(-)